MGEKKVVKCFWWTIQVLARFVLGKLLQQHDFNVEMAASAEEALEFWQPTSPMRSSWII